MEYIETVYGEALGEDLSSFEHPNPYFERKDFVSLDGLWDFCIDRSGSLPSSYSETIRVPFAVETRMSLIHRPVCKEDCLHYRKVLEIPEEKRHGFARIVFTAVDQEAKVFVDGELLKEHRFGYTPFDVFIPLKEKERIVLEVLARDDTESPLYGRGKQSNKSGGIWYHPTSGIWGSVYVEYLPDENYLTSLRIRPDYDAQTVEIEIAKNGVGKATAEVYFGAELLATEDFDGSNRATISLKRHFHPWDIDHPSLYGVKISCGKDLIRSVFAVRKVERKKVGDVSLLHLNDRPLFLSALLDQGYYPESGLTPPSTEAMKNDIETAKKLGFNCLRKHIKVEPMRWYFLCDSLGMYVIQDFVNGGSPYSFFAISAPALMPFYNPNDAHSKGLGRASLPSRLEFEKEMEETFYHLSNVSSILAWTLFNEGWGQFEAARMTKKLEGLDPSRLIDSTSGWHDKGVGDFLSKHIYFTPLKMKGDGKRILSLSEFGGFALKEEGHVEASKSFGYRIYKTEKGLSKGLIRLYSKVRSLVSKRGLGVAVYTELTDVEDELNGLLTYDRKVLKVDEALMRSLNKGLFEAFEAMVRQEEKKAFEGK